MVSYCLPLLLLAKTDSRELSESSQASAQIRFWDSVALAYRLIRLQEHNKVDLILLAKMCRKSNSPKSEIHVSLSKTSPDHAFKPPERKGFQLLRTGDRTIPERGCVECRGGGWWWCCEGAETGQTLSFESWAIDPIAHLGEVSCPPIILLLQLFRLLVDQILLRPPAVLPPRPPYLPDCELDRRTCS